jgi:hypothetical protein
MTDFLSTIAGQRLCANIASIAQSLRVIAQEIEKATKEQEQDNESK